MTQTAATMTGRDIRATVFTGRWHELIGGGDTFSPTTSTLISGASEAVLIDAQFTTEDVTALGNLIADSGKKLTTIYITHGHMDHYLGVGPLLERFPGARAVALPGVVDYIKKNEDFQSAVWGQWFGDAGVKRGPHPDVIEDRFLYVDGRPLEIIEVEQADVAPTTIVHAPDIDLVVAGDAIYNEIHPMLGMSTPDEWDAWLRTVDRIADLSPKIIAAGHKRPDADDRAVAEMVSSTRSYITYFRDAVRDGADADTLVTELTARFPGHGNRSTLLYSAAAATSATPAR